MTKHYPSCDCSEYSPRHEKHHETKVVFSCGTGTGANIPVNNQAVARAAVGSACWQPGLVVGTVNLDTRGLKNPSIKIDFSSVVSFRTIGVLFELAITFQLSRSCNNGQKVPLTTFTYEREVFPGMGEAPTPVEGLAIEFKDPIAFTWCDCHDCPGCCTYFVEIVDVEAIDIDFAIVGNVGINALAFGEKE